MIVLFLILLLSLIINKFIWRSTLSITLAWAIIIVIIAGGDSLPDYSNYKYVFEHVNTYAGYESEWLYYQLSLFAHNVLHLSYDTFRLMLVFFGMGLFNSTINRYVKNRSFALLLYLLYPFFIDAAQVRNFMAMTILLFSIRYLEKKSLKNIAKFTICIFAASGFQLTAIAYLLLILVYFKNSIMKYKLLWKISLAGLVLMALVPQILLSSINVLSSLFSDARIIIIEKIATRYGFILMWMIQGMMFGISSYAYRILMRMDNNGDNGDTVKLKENRQASFIRIVYIVNLVALAFFPLYRIHGDFFRFARNLMPLLYLQTICMTELAKSSADGGQLKDRILKLNLMTFAFACYNFITGIAITHWNDILLPAFSDNWILRIFLGK